MVEHCVQIRGGENFATAVGGTRSFILKTEVERCEPFDTPTTWATQGERPITELVVAPFVLSALHSKVYRSMSGATAVFRFIEGGLIE